MAWVLGFVLAAIIFGFHISIPLFIFAYMKTHGRTWLLSVIMAVVTIGVIWFAFEMALKSPVYRGIIFGG